MRRSNRDAMARSRVHSYSRAPDRSWSTKWSTNWCWAVPEMDVGPPADPDLRTRTYRSRGGQGYQASRRSWSTNQLVVALAMGGMAAHRWRDHGSVDRRVG